MEAIKDTSGVWMVKGTGTSCSRHLAELVMDELGMNDVGTRDRFVKVMDKSVEQLLDSVVKVELLIGG